MFLFTHFTSLKESTEARKKHTQWQWENCSEPSYRPRVHLPNHAHFPMQQKATFHRMCQQQNNGMCARITKMSFNDAFWHRLKLCHEATTYPLSRSCHNNIIFSPFHHFHNSHFHFHALQIFTLALVYNCNYEANMEK